MWNSDLSKAVGDARICMYVGTFIVNLQHLGRISVIINDHTRIANNSDAANFTGVQPAHMNMRIYTICKIKIQVRNIVNAWLQMGMRLHAYPLRLLSQKVE